MKQQPRDLQFDTDKLIAEASWLIRYQYRFVDIMLDYIADQDCQVCPLYDRCRRGELTDPERCREDILEEFKGRLQ